MLGGWTCGSPKLVDKKKREGGGGEGGLEVRERARGDDGNLEGAALGSFGREERREEEG